MLLRALILLCVISGIPAAAAEQDAAHECETSPTLKCLLKAFLQPYHSINCTINAVDRFTTLTKNFLYAAHTCRDGSTDSKEANTFIPIAKDIETHSETISKVCFNGIRQSPKIICGAKAIYNYNIMLTDLKKATNFANTSSKLPKNCFLDLMDRYVGELPAHTKSINRCIFVTPHTKAETEEPQRDEPAKKDEQPQRDEPAKKDEQPQRDEPAKKDAPSDDQPDYDSY